MVYMIAFGIMIPLVLMLFLLDEQSKSIVGAMIVGIVMCMFAGELNSWLMGLLGVSEFYMTITFTPIVEELLKGQIVLYFALYISSKRDRLLATSMAVGIGFALLENVNLFVVRSSELTYGLAIGRGLASGLMHGICTAVVGYGISFVRTRKKLFYTGTFGLLTVAIIYHATFNVLVQSEFLWLGLALPILTYIPGIIFIFRERRQRRKREASKKAAQAE